MKTTTEMSNIRGIVETVTNRDVYETLQANSELEDAIFQQLDKVQVLASVQCQIDASDSPTPLPNRIHYSQLLNEQILELRNLIDRYVG